jgi:hypothetical protein
MKEGGEKKVSQRAMVQAALEHTGWDSKPAELQTYIKETYSVELAPNIISNYKSQIKRETQSPVAATRTKTSSGGLQIDDFALVRTLVTRLGANQVKQLVDVIED